MKKILIICHSFPPYPGIGGRRWVKFAKYLNKQGHLIKVIASENPFTETSQWLKDAEGLDITYLPFNYPKVLKKASHPGILDKLAYRLALMRVRSKGKGNYHDRSLFWEEQILRSAGEIISKHNIKNVIVTCPPFHLAYFCTKLKSAFPNVRLITDFRDLWTGDLSLSALKNMPAERQEHERSIEKEVLDRSDAVLCVSDKMCEDFKKIVPANKYHTLINGYDEEDFERSNLKERTDGKINLVFTGTLYVNLQNIFVPFVEALRKLKKEEPSLYSLLSFQFYGSAPVEIKKLTEGIEAITLHGNVSLKEVYQKIAASDACLLFLTDTYTFSLSTKFYEYISQKKKIILFSKQGETSQFIEKNNLGYWIAPENSYEGLKSILELHKKGELQRWNSEIDINAYSVKNLTKQLESYLA